MISFQYYRQADRIMDIMNKDQRSQRISSQHECEGSDIRQCVFAGNVGATPTTRGDKEGAAAKEAGVSHRRCGPVPELAQCNDPRLVLTEAAHKKETPVSRRLSSNEPGVRL